MVKESKFFVRVVIFVFIFYLLVPVIMLDKQFFPNKF